MSRDFRVDGTPVNVLNYEIIHEQVTALGRMGRALEMAIAKLRDFDAAHPRTCAAASAKQARRTLVMAASRALWMFVVQREACGLRDSRTLMRDYNVPSEVQQHMGAADNRMTRRKARRSGGSISSSDKTSVRLTALPLRP